jgi:uncharacterized protein
LQRKIPGSGVAEEQGFAYDPLTDIGIFIFAPAAAIRVACPGTFYNRSLNSAKRASAKQSMSVISYVQPLYSSTGFAVGLLVGLTGVGGGSLMTPLLILLFGIHPATAVGTDLLYAAATKSAGSVVHGLNRTIDWRLVGLLACGSVPLTIVTLALLDHIDISSTAARDLITVVLAVALLITAVTLVLRDKIVARYATRIGALQPKQVAISTVALGAGLGVLVSISSVGAGAIGVTALLLLYPGMPTARIVGTDIAHAVPLTLAAGVGHWFLGSINTQVLISLLVGSIPGILIGSYAAVRIPETVLRFVLAAVLVVVATKLSFDMHQAAPTKQSASTKEITITAVGVRSRPAVNNMPQR